MSQEFVRNILKTVEEIDKPRSNLYKKFAQYRISQETDGEEREHAL